MSFMLEAPSKGDPVVFAPMRIEAYALMMAMRSCKIVRTGMGPHRAKRTVSRISDVLAEAPAVVVAGFCGGVTEGLKVGDVVVASSITVLDAESGERDPIDLPDASLLVRALRRAGHKVHVGNIASTDHIVLGDERIQIEKKGALAVDMESAWLVPERKSGAFAVVRVVLDTGDEELLSPALAVRALRASKVLMSVGRVVQDWTETTRPRRVLAAKPRSFCAGVERAIECVERALAAFGPPIYVRKQIVHNQAVVSSLEDKGAVFVDELDEVPDGARVVFSAHGVAPEVNAEAEAKHLEVIDATCPLVAKVHQEARRLGSSGHEVILIGHRGHEETVGTMGHHPGMHLVSTVEEVEMLPIAPGSKVALLSQTTMAVDEVTNIANQIAKKFPLLAGPGPKDICYATQNRQEAVKALAQECEVVLVVGSQNSSNSKRLVEVAQRSGCKAYLIENEMSIDLDLIKDAASVGVTAGASAPEELFQRVVRAISALGPTTFEEREVVDEEVNFSLPAKVRAWPYR
ncbi:MAG: 4-hydroxy-3-methylbut-2-enyl diphosphate reductase [Actinobacteria bacterium]|jgi:4-hydroxy-3-methylbut-2-enyl diphosphate reductase|nr:4-hydroxy-3-methylbut-2-enyl diphosphate reductase [Actinomycetota bacterium]MCL6095415.1 4-hydroxy-3-methylbut-2-enyl diphosphate reductase [Actinomycetota bacterium]